MKVHRSRLAFPTPLDVEGRSKRLYRLISLILLGTCLLACSGGPKKLPSSRFGELRLYKSNDTSHGAVIFFTGDAGWDSDEEALVRAMNREGYFVIGVDSSDYLDEIGKDGGTCSYLAGEIERLGQSAQQSFGIQHFHKPILVGYSAGSALVYAALAETTKPFLGGVALAFCPDQEFLHPLCGNEGIITTFKAETNEHFLKPRANFDAPWKVLHGADDTECPFSNAQRFLGPSLEASAVVFPDVGHDIIESRDARRELMITLEQISRREGPLNKSPHADLADLPLVEVPANVSVDNPPPTTDAFAVFLSGDGGWATVDKEVGGYLGEHGIPVVGFDSLRYFWTHKKVKRSAKDVARVINSFSTFLHKSRVILIGYSLGADVLPHIVAAMDPTTQAKISKLVLISPERQVDFEVHIGDWIGFPDPNRGMPIAPEFLKIKAVPTLCIYGDEEKDDSLCTVPELAVAKNIKLAGGHHFGGDYESVGQEIIEATAPAS